MPRSTKPTDVCSLVLALAPILITSSPASASDRIAIDTYARLPLAFEANEGQTSPAVKFLARGDGYTLFLTETEAVLVLRDAARSTSGPPHDHARASRAARSRAPLVLRIRVVDAQTTVVAGRDKLPGTASYFRGKEPARWRTGVPAYARVHYDEVYPGIDLVYYGNQRDLEWDFIVAPGADPRVIRLAFDGADRLSDDGDGNLVLTLGPREMRLAKPVVYQEVDGVRHPVEARYRRLGTGDVAVEVGPYDVSRPLVIDPVFTYSTYLGGAGDDDGIAIAVDAAGQAYVAGFTTSPNFPVRGAAQPAPAGGLDVFVTKFDKRGAALVYSTYLGGSGDDIAFGLAVAADRSGNAYVTGSTNSADFPVTPGAFQPAFRGGAFGDVFVTKLDRTGSRLVYSTYLGGTGDEFGLAIALDASNNAYIAGQTTSADFPTTAGAFDRTYNGPTPAGPLDFGDVFVAKLNATGTGLVYSTYLGGVLNESARGIGVDSAANAIVTGITNSPNFPTKDAAQPVPGGGFDVFVAKLTADGSTLRYSTYLGGSGDDLGSAVAVDQLGNAYVAGGTSSPNYPTTPGAFQTVGRGAFDAFVTKLTPTGSLAYSTLLGGSGDDIGNGVAVDALGQAHVVGSTSSADFPTTPEAAQRTNRGSFDAFVTKLDATGSAIRYSTYFGGTRDDFGLAIALDPDGNAYFTGGTSSTDFPTSPDAFQRTIGGGTCLLGLPPEEDVLTCDAFVVKLLPVDTTLPFPTGWMTGGGKIVSAQNVTHSLNLHCDTNRTPNKLEVHWDKGNAFTLETMTGAACRDMPGTSPGKPDAGFDTHEGIGTGRYNGQPGATAKWRFTDGGEPGRDDTAEIEITVGGVPVLAVAGPLNGGNHQAHSK